MSEWKEIELERIVNFYNGKKRPYIKGNIPVFGGNGILDYCNSFNSQGESIIIGRVGEYCGNVNYYNGFCWISDNAILVKAKEELNVKYLYYCLINVKLREFQVGSSQPLITQEILKNIIIPLPPLPEQKAIAEVLSSIDDKIDLLHRQNKTLEEMAMTLFRQWFIEPTKDGLPKGWEIGKFEENLKIVYGKNLLTSKLKDSGYPVFGGNGKIGYYTEYMYEESQVLISCRGEASGKVNISDPKSYITNNSLILERAKNKNISFEYLKYYCLNYDFTQFVTGSAQPQITIEELNNAEILIPPSILINKFSKIISNFETKIFSNKIQIQTLEKLRDTLLPKLMSGEVRVKV